MFYCIAALFFLQTIIAIGRPRYECGEHGRFEYCVDGIPGCVVGCHCHPGFYFDTETKICEPNQKLAEDYRRLYPAAEPTRVQVTPVTTAEEPEVTLPTPTTTNVLENRVEAVTNDTEDLGDWLYNQFFKTIENQVLNKTEKKPLTRRSNGASIKTSKRKKKRKNTFKKMFGKKDSLRKKLLSITEDDSMFRSHSSGDSSSSDSSGSSQSSSDSDSSVESNEHKEKHTNDKEHGHRKIVVVKKKPKAPLPSFIFLPNMETPFFPPFGLPAPPAMPMYPMVPVPPVPAYPFPGMPQGDCDNNNKENNNDDNKDKHKDADNSSPEASSRPPDKDDVITTTTATTTTQPTTTTTTQSPREVKLSHKYLHNTPDTPDLPDSPPGVPSNMLARNRPPHEPPSILRSRVKHGQRKKMLEQLRDRMHLPPLSQIEQFGPPRRNKNKEIPNDLSTEQDIDYPLMVENAHEPPVIPNALMYKYNNMEENPHDNVDFKYLSQLIHRIDLNNTKDSKPKSPDEAWPSWRSKKKHEVQNVTPITILPSRRFNKANEIEDSYYSKLGQQIAALIRKIDSGGERQVNIEIEKSQPKASPHPIFNENNYGARSYWERSVRSALHYPPYANDFNYLKANNDRLYNLENKVKIFATTAQPLSLGEIENVIYLMDKAKIQLQNKIDNMRKVDISNTSLNINLLPHQKTRTITSAKTFLKSPSIFEPLLRQAGSVATINLKPKPLSRPPPQQLQSYSPPKNRSINDYMKSNNLHYNLRGILMSSFLKALPKYPSQPIVNVTYAKIDHPKAGPLEARIGRNLSPQSLPVQALKTAQGFRRNEGFPLFGIPTSKPPKQAPNLSYFQNPQLINYKNTKIYANDNNQYVYEKRVVPIQVPVNQNKYLGKNTGTSYFHHELHHFDYFD